MPTPGDTICGEIVLERLAPASLGADVFQPVFVARDLSRDEALWLTVVDGAFVPTSVDMSRFMAGANALVGVRHPSLVRVVLVDREEDYCVVGYEQLPGAEALGDLVVRGGSRRLLARAAVELARGLAFLHRRELLHGTLTPSTVVLWEGVPVLWEHGLAGLCDCRVFGPRARTLGGDVVAPEVPMGNPLTPAVDVYAWGAVMAAVASGSLGAEAVSAVLGGDVDPGRHGPLLGVVRQALSVEPSQRPRDGVHLLELLQRALSSADPSTDLEGRAPAPGTADGGLQDLARRYLAEMESMERSGGSGSGRVPGPTGRPITAPPGALGRLNLVKRPAENAGDAGPGRGSLVGPPIQEIDRRAESSGPLPVSGPVAEEPDWSHRLPSSAVAEVPKTAGPGLVRGPQPGVSGADAGLLAASQSKASDSSARWVSRPPEVSASGWLRPAPAKVGLGGLFDARAGMRELADGVRKRSILRPGSLPSPPAAQPPRSGVPDMISEEEATPQEPIDLGSPIPTPIDDSIRPLDEPYGNQQALDDLLDQPPSERETPPDMEVIRARAGRAPLPEPPEPEPPPEPELPPEPEPELPPVPEASRSADPAVSRSRPVEPFRIPRGPGPHGPPSVVMGAVITVLAGGLALGATLSASSARGGFAHLLGRGVDLADLEGPPEAPPPAAGSGEEPAPVVPASPCEEGMLEIRDDAGPFCIDRAEYPGLDRVPATEVDLPHAERACAARGHALCTEAQWGRACRGSSGWRFPYGPRREAGRCRVGDPTASPGPSGTDPHCVTPEGVLDLVGNVAEWTVEGVVMGGSVQSKKTAGCGTRQRLKPQTKRPAVGFRCCAELSPPPGSGPTGTASGDGG